MKSRVFSCVFVLLAVTAAPTAMGQPIPLEDLEVVYHLAGTPAYPVPLLDLPGGLKGHVSVVNAYLPGEPAGAELGIRFDVPADLIQGPPQGALSGDIEDNSHVFKGASLPVGAIRTFYTRQGGVLYAVDVTWWVAADDLGLKPGRLRISVREAGNGCPIEEALE